MNKEIAAVLAQIPERHDFASYAMLLGIVLSLLLVFVIFVRSKKNTALFFLGMSLLFQSIIFLDTFLCYTGLIKHAIIFNDSTEPLVLMVPVMIYLFTYCLIRKERLSFKKQLPYYIFPIFYGLSQIPFYLAPLGVKLNAYLDAYYDTLGTVSVPDDFSYSYQWIKDHFDWLILISFLVYGLLGLKLVWEERGRIAKLPNQANAKRYILTRNGLIILFVTLSIVFTIFYNYDDDGGDHYIGMINAIISIIMVYVFLADSRFFEKSWFKDKYATLSSDDVSFSSVDLFLNEADLFLSQDISLSKLADKMQASQNVISKAINSKTGMNFNDYINSKRVTVAKKRLTDAHFENLTIEAIGSSVGFRSKSTFYTAFKKHMGMSPSNYIKSLMPQNRA